MNSEIRLVPMTESVVADLIAGKVSARSLIFQSFYAAPADPAEAVRRSLTQVIVQGDTGRMALSVTDEEALAVLRALGLPGAPA